MHIPTWLIWEVIVTLVLQLEHTFPNNQYHTSTNTPFVTHHVFNCSTWPSLFSLWQKIHLHFMVFQPFGSFTSSQVWFFMRESHLSQIACYHPLPFGEDIASLKVSGSFRRNTSSNSLSVVCHCMGCIFPSIKSLSVF